MAATFPALRAAGAFCLLWSLACAKSPPAEWYVAPPTAAPAPAAPLPSHAEYDLLGWTTGQACSGDAAKVGLLGTTAQGLSTALLNEARYAALEALPAADSLLFERIHTWRESGKRCVKVTARGFRVTSLSNGP